MILNFFIFVIYSLIPEINLFSLHGKMNNKRYRIFELFWKAERGKYEFMNTVFTKVETEIHLPIYLTSGSLINNFYSILNCGLYIKIN